GKGSLEYSLVLQRIGSALKETGAYNDATAKCRKAFDIQQRIFGATGPISKEVLNCLADAAEKVGDPKTAATWYEWLAAVSGRDSQEPAQNTIDALMRLTNLYEEQGLPERAIAKRRQIVALLESRPEAEQQGNIEFHLLHLGEALLASKSAEALAVL